jgi:hypothetical protein
MAELKTTEEELPSSELASDDIPAKQPEGPKLVKGQEPETLDKAGKLKPVVETVLPLSDARRAHELNETGHARGKTVLKVA